MSIAAVICEFNPFHNGHKYLLEQIKNQGYDTVICVMSGSFTQRGEVALLSKFTRAKIALQNGADLVIELPTPYAVASAQRFAAGGVDVIRNLGVVDAVFFGSECGDEKLIMKAAEATENPCVAEKLKEYMQGGDYYPSALQKAVSDVYGKALASVVASPNNTLGVEYCRELKKYGIEAKTIYRKGAPHDSKVLLENTASASFIREKLLDGEDISSLVPLYNEKDFSNPASFTFGERGFLYRLRTITEAELKNVPDVSEGLENRIISCAGRCSTVEELLFEIKTKRYTMARLRRILCCALLGVTKDMQSTPLPYLRILGMTEKGSSVLSLISEKTSLPIVANVAPSMKTLSDDALKILSCDIKATDIRCIFEKTPGSSNLDYTTPVIKI